jgi:hypothetical protein
MYFTPKEITGFIIGGVGITISGSGYFGWVGLCLNVIAMLILMDSLWFEPMRKK